MFLAYLGPETILPATSAVAAVIGCLMMFGKHAGLWAVASARLIGRRFTRKRRTTSNVPAPHFHGRFDAEARKSVVTGEETSPTSFEVDS